MCMKVCMFIKTRNVCGKKVEFIAKTATVGSGIFCF